jgi:glycerol-3-phosphate dehydrogenase
VEVPSLEPRALDEEIEFILETAARYLSRPPSRADVLAVYVGLRPLVKSDGEGKTSSLSRDHVIHVDTSGLLTITGGKWTTYRHMAEDCVDHAITLGRLRDEACITKNLRIHGHMEASNSLMSDEDHLGVYGSDAESIRKLARDPALAVQLHPDLPYIAAEVVWAARTEMARSVEDVLARRTRALFLNARAAMAMAEPVGALLAAELGRDDAWTAAQVVEFQTLAKQYVVQEKIFPGYGG